MGNPNHLISLLPPKVREAIQHELDAKVAEDLVEELFGKPRKEMEMTARTPKITRNECASLIDNLLCAIQKTKKDPLKVTKRYIKALKYLKRVSKSKEFY